MDFDQTSTQDTIHDFVFPRHSNQPFLVELNFDAQLAIIVKKIFSENIIIQCIQI